MSMKIQQHNFWAADLDAAALYVKQNFPNNASECIALADEICQNSFMFRGHWEMERTHTPVCFADKIIWDKIPDGDPEWVYAFNRHSFFVVLGQAWRLTQNPKYGDAFARLAAAWLQDAPFTKQSKTTTWRAIETGIRCETWLRAFSLFENHPSFTPSLRQAMEESLASHGRWLMQAHAPFQRLSNWGVLQNHGLLLLGLAFNNDEWFQTAASRLEDCLHLQVLPDGTHWEQSPMYQGEVLHCCLDSILATRAAGRWLPPPFEADTLSLARGLATLCRPDGKLLCQSDSDEIDARDLLQKAGLLFRNPLLKAYAGAQLFLETVWDFGPAAANLYAALPFGQTQGSVALPHSGNYMLWDGTAPDSGFLHFHCGSLGSGHGHGDLLHIDLVCNGEVILADSGRYTYVDSPLRRQLKEPAAHNTTRVDGESFSQCKDSWGYHKMAEPIKEPHHFGLLVDYAAGSHLGYWAQGVFTRRRILRLGHGLWFGIDSFYPTEANTVHQYEQFFHFGPEGTTTMEDNSVVYSGKKTDARITFPSNSSTYNIQRSACSREYNRLEESDCLSIITNKAGTTGLAFAIATEKAGQAPPLLVEEIPVCLAAKQTLLSSWQAQAFSILAPSGRWVIIVCHTEVIAEVDLLAAGGYTGYGRVLVFGPGCEQGLCLAW